MSSERLDIAIGLTGTVRWIVGPQHLASAVGSGTVDVFATPMLIALMEAAAVEATRGRLQEGEVSVGTHIDVSHEGATPAGLEVMAMAEIVAIEGRVLTFRVEARDPHQVIGRGTHKRAIASKARFEAKAAAKL